MVHLVEFVGASCWFYLPPKKTSEVITDVLLAFAITKTVDEELFEASAKLGKLRFADVRKAHPPDHALGFCTSASRG